MTLLVGMSPLYNYMLYNLCDVGVIQVIQNEFYIIQAKKRREEGMTDVSLLPP